MRLKTVEYYLIFWIPNRYGLKDAQDPLEQLNERIEAILDDFILPARRKRS